MKRDDILEVEPWRDDPKTCVVCGLMTWTVHE